MATATPTARTATPWSPVLDGSRAENARAIALDVASCIVDRSRREAALVAASRQTQFPEAIHWAPYSIAQGDAGLALFCGYLDAHQPDCGWDRIGHGFLQAAVAGFEGVSEAVSAG